MSESKIRMFETGATRDGDTNKFDYEGFLSPRVLRAYGAYMHKHRKQPDGAMRDSDNWQKGMDFKTYMKSLCRHFIDLWSLHRGLIVYDDKNQIVTIEDALNGILFNTMGYFHEYLKWKEQQNSKELCGCTSNEFPPTNTVVICDKHIKEAIAQGKEIRDNFKAKKDPAKCTCEGSSVCGSGICGDTK